MKAIGLLLLLVACGDNIKPDARPDASVYRPDARALPLPPEEVDVGPIKPGDDMVVEPGGDPKGACLFGMLNGKVPHECAPPPGRCKQYGDYIVCKGA